MIPKPPKKRATNYEKQKARKRFRRRAGIEPVIGHLKSDYRLGRNFLKGKVGDSINLMMAAAAFNFKKLLKQLSYFFRLFFFSVLLANNKNF
jgi:transposase, IS5 family